jgi:hypothetical protein
MTLSEGFCVRHNQVSSLQGQGGGIPHENGRTEGVNSSVHSHLDWTVSSGARHHRRKHFQVDPGGSDASYPYSLHQTNSLDRYGHHSPTRRDGVGTVWDGWCENEPTYVKPGQETSESKRLSRMNLSSYRPMSNVVPKNGQTTLPKTNTLADWRVMRRSGGWTHPSSSVLLDSSLKVYRFWGQISASCDSVVSSSHMMRTGRT